MAESSYPQPGLKPGDGPDCGAYTASQWRGYNVAKMRSSGMIQSSAPVLPTVAQYPDVGVFYVVPDRLAVTSPGANQITVATGASLVDGTLHYNDTAHTAVAITGPLGNPRIDVVVVRQNYGGVAWPSPNAPALSVPANTARIAIISGAENVAPVAPGLVQDTTRATYWDIPLAQYQIAVGGAITNLTDRREWVDAEMKTFWVQPVRGHNITDSTEMAPSYNLAFPEYGPVIPLADNKGCQVIGRFMYPRNLISVSDLTVYAVVYAPAGGAVSIYSRLEISAGACGEGARNHQNVPALSQTVNPYAQWSYWCINANTLPAAAATGDIVYLRFYRDAVNILDTVGAAVYFVGWYGEYLGWGRK